MIRTLIYAFVTAVLAGWLLEQAPVRREILLPFRIARLYTQAPDARLPTPVEGARVERDANTWHAAHTGATKARTSSRGAARRCCRSPEGIVVRVNDRTLGGNSVFVLGPGGRTCFYTHLDHYAAAIRAGEEVTPETVLGYAGNTGNARTTPPHLHFGVYAAAGAINPLPLIVDRPAATAASLRGPSRPSSPGSAAVFRQASHRRGPVSR